jgi:L-ascorbate metabolism protein UlaG (beta-lactamase superfamily)
MMGEDWVVPEQRTKPVLSGEQLRNEVEKAHIGRGEVAVWWLTQASWLVKFRTTTILIDPWWRDLEAGDRWGKLLGEFPLTPEEHPKVDFIFCTHWHDDHICPIALPRLAKAQPHAKFIVPLRSRQMLLDLGIPRGRIHSMRGNDSGQLKNGLSFFAIPAAHEELDSDPSNAHLYLGFVLRCDGVTVFHMGDSRPYPGWIGNIKRAATMLNFDGDQSAAIDLALLCINGNDNLAHDEAVDVALAIDAGVVIPMHYGMDPGNTVDPQIFADEMEARAPDIAYVVPKSGELLHIS